MTSWLPGRDGVAMSGRYALYFAPPAAHALWNAGCAWLGRDPTAEFRLDGATIPGLPPDLLARATATPRRYGLHATLKAPFRLAAGVRPEDLLEALEEFAHHQPAFPLLRLAVARIGKFLALIPAGPDPRVASVERDCVMHFDDFRAAPDAAELARRLHMSLDQVEHALLRRWGYPYVLERYRFHLSLTGSLEGIASDIQEIIAEAARAHFAAALDVALYFDAISIFKEPGPGENFLLWRRVRLGN